MVAMIRAQEEEEDLTMVVEEDEVDLHGEDQELDAVVVMVVAAEAVAMAVEIMEEEVMEDVPVVTMHLEVKLLRVILPRVA